MKIAIMGAGALGGSFGFLLAESGLDVTLVDVDEAKIDALRREGLTLVMPDGSRRHRSINATTRPEDVGVVDLVQISVKGYHTTSAAELARPMVGPDTYVLSLQNGLKNLQRISAVLPHARVIGGVTGYSAMPLDVTTIRFTPSSAGITLGRYDGSEDPELAGIAAAFAGAGLETHLVHGDIREPIWRKLLANVAVNAVAALTGLTGREVKEIEPAQRLVRALAQETAAVARAQGFTFAELEEPDDWVVSTLDWVGDNKVSMVQDMEHGRRTEVDTLNLAVVERGEQFGVDTPLNWVVGLLVQIREQKMLRDRQAAARASGNGAASGSIEPPPDTASAESAEGSPAEGSPAVEATQAPPV